MLISKMRLNFLTGAHSSFTLVTNKHLVLLVKCDPALHCGISRDLCEFMWGVESYIVVEMLSPHALSA